MCLVLMITFELYYYSTCYALRIKGKMGDHQIHMRSPHPPPPAPPVWMDKNVLSKWNNVLPRPHQHHLLQLPPIPSKKARAPGLPHPTISQSGSGWNGYIFFFSISEREKTSLPTPTSKTKQVGPSPSCLNFSLLPTHMFFLKKMHYMGWPKIS